MAHRINERNSGNWSLESEPKYRRSKKQKLSQSEMEFAREILQRVYDALQYDSQLSERGHLHPDSVWTDGGRFVVSLTGEQKDLLFNIIHERNV